MNIEREYIHFRKHGDKLIEHRFRSSMQWPKNGRLYSLASDPDAIERCKQMAFKTDEERAVEKAAADALHERCRIKQTAMPVMHVEEPAPPTPQPAAVPSPNKPPTKISSTATTDDLKVEKCALFHHGLRNFLGPFFIREFCRRISGDRYVGNSVDQARRFKPMKMLNKFHLRGKKSHTTTNLSANTGGRNQEGKGL